MEALEQPQARDTLPLYLPNSQLLGIENRILRTECIRRLWQPRNCPPEGANSKSRTSQQQLPWLQPKIPAGGQRLPIADWCLYLLAASLCWQAGRGVGDGQWDLLFVRRMAEWCYLWQKWHKWRVSSAGSGFWTLDRDLHHIKEIAQTPGFSFLVSLWFPPHPRCQPRQNSKAQGRKTSRPGLLSKASRWPDLLFCWRMEKVFFTLLSSTDGQTSPHQKLQTTQPGTKIIRLYFSQFKAVKLSKCTCLHEAQGFFKFCQCQ